MEQLKNSRDEYYKNKRSPQAEELRMKFEKQKSEFEAKKIVDKHSELIAKSQTSSYLDLNRNFILGEHTINCNATRLSELVDIVVVILDSPILNSRTIAYELNLDVVLLSVDSMKKICEEICKLNEGLSKGTIFLVKELHPQTFIRKIEIFLLEVFLMQCSNSIPFVWWIHTFKAIGKLTSLWIAFKICNGESQVEWNEEWIDNMPVYISEMLAFFSNKDNQMFIEQFSINIRTKKRKLEVLDQYKKAFRKD